MHRREALKKTALFIGIAIAPELRRRLWPTPLPPLHPATCRPPPFAGCKMADTILPDTDTPGARPPECMSLYTVIGGRLSFAQAANRILVGLTIR